MNYKEWRKISSKIDKVLKEFDEVDVCGLAYGGRIVADLPRFLLALNGGRLDCLAEAIDNDTDTLLDIEVKDMGYTAIVGGTGVTGFEPIGISKLRYDRVSQYNTLKRSLTWYLLSLVGVRFRVGYKDVVHLNDLPRELRDVNFDSLAGTVRCVGKAGVDAEEMVLQNTVE